MFMPKWFQLFLAGLCVFGVMLLFFGANNSATVSLREVDASIGLIQRPHNSRILERAKLIFRPVRVNAQIPVTNTSDIPRILEQAVRAALNFLIAQVINRLTAALTDLFKGLISKIEGWINKIQGLRDSQSSWEGAISMKGFQIAECLNKSTNSLTNEIIAEFIPSRPSNDVARQLRADYTVNQSRVNPACGGAEEPTASSAEYEELQNAIASTRINNLVVYGQQTQQEQVTDVETLTNQTSGEDTGASRPANIGPIPSEENIESNVSLIAEIMAKAACAVNDAPSTSDANVISLDQISRGGNANCVEGSIRAGVIRAIGIQLSEDIAIRDRISAQIKGQAPADCGFGYTQEGQNASAALLNSATPGSIANAAVSDATLIEAKNLTNEQCNNLDRVPSTRDKIAATAQTATSEGPQTFSFSGLLTTVLNELKAYGQNIINDLFTLFDEQISRIIDNIGNSYVGQVLGGVATTIYSNARTSLQEIQDQLSN